MKNLRNYVQLIGHTGQDVNTMTFDSGTQKASVTFATSNYYKNGKGEIVSQTQWHNLVAWGKMAELLSKACKKGDQLIVKGSLQYRQYENKDGINIQITEILVDDFMRTRSSKNTSTTKEKEAALPF